MDGKSLHPLEAFGSGILTNALFGLGISPIVYGLFWGGLDEVFFHTFTALYVMLFVVYGFFGLLFGLDLYTDLPIPGKPTPKRVRSKDCFIFGFSTGLGFFVWYLYLNYREINVFQIYPFLIYSGIFPGLSAYLGALSGNRYRTRN